MLLRHHGELVTRDEMRDRLWPSDTFVDFNHGLNAAVNKLREALNDSADQPRYIETLPRRGYRFIGEIEWLPAKPVPAPSALSTADSSLPISNDAEVIPSVLPDATLPSFAMKGEGRPARGPYLAAGAAVLSLLIAGGVAIWNLRSTPELSAHAMAQRTRPLLSVSNTANPAFSPDGNSVAFYREGEQGSGIFVTRVGSDQLQQLTNNERDCCPVWSPDGRWIAFSRVLGDEHEIYVVAADGREQKRAAERSLGAQPAAYVDITATARRVDTRGVIPKRGEMDWSPDGKSIAFVGPGGIYQISPDSSEVRRVVSTPVGSEDWGPQFSSDGRRLLFVRNRQIGEPDEIWTVSTAGGDATRLLTERGKISSPPQWSADGGSVIFSANRTGHPQIFRASVDSPDSSVLITDAAAPAWDPAVSRHGYRLAYERLLRSLSIWQLDLTNSAEKHPYLLVSSTSDTDQGPGPQFSPDGKKLAYMSDRNGTMEIWIANRDGSDAFQLTAVGGAGTPRWSPDSQAVAFDVGTTTGMKIVTMNLHGGGPQVLADGVCPSWSRDGKWVYFASTRNGQRQVWKIPAGGGASVQVTQNGGHAALESPDGKYLYYAKNAMAEPEIWRVPVNGGEEQPVPLVRPGTWASWQVVDGGILFVGPSLGHQAVLSYYDATKNRTSTVSILERTPFWLGATLDGKLVAFDQPGREQAQAMLVENFR
jgi:Tol biopolymer transport system component/DNA-binding winged helix-turn-helix (wHTH) protein